MDNRPNETANEQHQLLLVNSSSANIFNFHEVYFDQTMKSTVVATYLHQTSRSVFQFRQVSRSVLESTATECVAAALKKYGRFAIPC